MRFSIKCIVAILQVSLFYFNVISQEPVEILPVGQIRDIGQIGGIEKKLEEQESQQNSLSPELRLKSEKRMFEFHLLGGMSLEAMYDTRQVIGDRFNEFIFFPAPQDMDNSGLDINAKDQFSMMGVRACCSLQMKGPDIWDAKTFGVMEGEFNGINDETVRLFRLTRASVTFEWENTKVLFGHYYHPLVLDEMYPETISRGQGRVYDPYSYAPQIRLRQKVRQFEFVFAIAKQFNSQGARWATLPDLFTQFNLYVKDHIFGIGINYHCEVPRIYSQNPPQETGLPVISKYKTTSQIDSLYPFVFAVLKFEPFDVRMRATYAENGSVYDLIGAYAVQCRNEVTDERLLVNLRTLACWTDIIYKRWSNIEPAIFIGLSKNLGASKKIIKGYDYPANSENPEYISMLNVGDSYENIDYTFIFAPRLKIRFGEFSLGAEIEYTRASFARPFVQTGWENDFDDTGKVVCGKPVSNLRILLATFYNFDYSPFAYK